jgi:hypothetical protein
MYLLYVDESGDVGIKNSPTKYFVLSALIIHESKWRNTLDELVKFRNQLRDTKGLKLREEIHCTELINRPKELVRIKRNDRLDIIKKCIDWLNTQENIEIFSVVKNKINPNEDVFNTTWIQLLHTFEEHLKTKHQNEKGIILSDNTDGEKLRILIRGQRHTNNDRINKIIEDPIFRDSRNSLLHQMNDVIAYCVRQNYEPNAFMKKKGGHNYFQRLKNVVIKNDLVDLNGLISI